MTEPIWSEKYTPKTLSELSFNTFENKILDSLANSSDFPHLIFYGPPGAGKKTRMHCFLEKVYGEGIYKMTVLNRDLKLDSKTIQYVVTTSIYHLEFCPSDLGNNDKNIISTVIKETSNTAQLDPSAQKSFKVIVIHEADKLTNEAQSALRRTMEKYSSNCRIIMIANDLSNIIDPLQSRCFSIRLSLPKDDDIANILKTIAKKESVNPTEQFYRDIIEKSNYNLRLSISALQLLSLGEGSEISYSLPFQKDINDIIDVINKNKSAKGIEEIRKSLFELLIRGLNYTTIINHIVDYYINNDKISDNTKISIINAANLYDMRAANGTKVIVHLESFVAKIMFILYKEQNK